MPFQSDAQAEDAFPIGAGEHRYPVPLAQIIEAQKLGEQAVHAGITPGRGHYVADRTPQGRYLALMWLRGYRAEQQRLADERAAASDADRG